jgi:hypothetical protein
MRRSLGLLAAFAMLLSLGALMASPAAAAGGTTCRSITADAEFSPPLPIFSKQVKIASTVTFAGTVGSCSGGTVKSGTFTGTYRIKAGNCTTLLAYTATPIAMNITTTWNTNKTSTAAIQLHAIKADPSKRTLTGAVTAGLFKGSRTSATFTIALLTKKGCLVTPLKELSVTGGPAVIE